jgi:hypothetical protein
MVFKIINIRGVVIVQFLIDFYPDPGVMSRHHRKVNQAAEKLTLIFHHPNIIMASLRPSNRILMVAVLQMMRSIPLRMKLRWNLLNNRGRKG